MGNVGPVLSAYQNIDLVRAETLSWGGSLLDFLCSGRKLMCLSHSGLSTRYCAVRYMHIVSGHKDLSFRAFRIQAFSKAMKRKPQRRKKSPPAADLAQWLHVRRFVFDPNNDTAKCIRGANTARVFPPHAYMRSKILQGGLQLFRGNGKRNLPAISRKSKNGQGGLGVARTIFETGLGVCPVKGVAKWPIASDRDPDSEAPTPLTFALFPMEF